MIVTLKNLDVPALIVGLILAAYWYRVTRMATKMRRKTGRAANFVPVEPLGRLLRIIWQPVVFLWVVHPLFTAFVRRAPLILTPMFRPPLLRWAGVAVAVVSYGLTRICWRRMGRSWRMGIDPGEKTTLVVTGPYAFVRHPIYALSSLLMVATVVIVPSPLMVVVGLLHLLLLQWEARREEANLVSVHGIGYADYRRATGRFFPKFGRGYVAGAGRQPA